MTLWGDFVVGGLFVAVMGFLLVVVIQSSRCFRVMDQLIKEDPAKADTELARWRYHADHPFGGGK